MSSYREKCIKFDQKYGEITFVKLILSSINKLLVRKRIVTAKQLQQGLLKEIAIFKKESDNL